MKLPVLLTFSQWSLRARVSALVSVPLVCITLLTVYNINTALNREADSLQNRSEKMLLLAANTAQLALFAGDEASLNSLRGAMTQDPQIADVLFFDDGKQLFKPRGDTPSRFTSSKLDKTNNYIEGDYWYFITPVKSSGIQFDDNPEQYLGADTVDVIGWVVLVVDLRESYEYRTSMLANNLLIALLMLAVALWLAFRFSQAVVQPVNKITSALERYGREDYGYRVDETSAGELGSLEKGINTLAERVGQSQLILKEEVEKATKKWVKAARDLEVQNVDLIEAKNIADEANAAKDDFLARMSHELRTPLTGIMGFVRLLATTDQPKMRQEYSEIIMTSSSVLLSTINDILDFSKLRAHSFSLNPSYFSLVECLQDVLDLHRIAAFEKSIELNMLIDSDVPDEVFTDIDKFKKVVNNIVSNAVKFTPSGDIVVFAALVERQHEEAVISISIKDTGVGISSADITRLFNPFFQSDESSTRSHDGTGLGLAIAEDFVALMGGDISVESDEGEGTEVEFTFRCGLRESVGESQEPDKTCRTVLYDNNPWTRRSWRNQLLGYSTDVLAPISFDRLLATLAEPESIEMLLLGFNAKDSNLETLQSQLKGIRTEFAGVIILAAADSGGIELVGLCEEYAPLVITSKPLGNHRLAEAFHKASVEYCNAFRSGANTVLTTQPRTFTSSYQLQGINILVAEDNPFNQQLLATLLEATGAVVTLASDGQEAQKLCDDRRYDILLFDLHMPKLNGVQLSESIRASSEENRETPIIILTADVLTEQATSIMDAGVDAISYKPIDEEDLIQKISSLSAPKGASVQQPKRALLTLGRKQIEAEVNSQLEHISKAIEAGDYEHMQAQVHQLLGVIGLAGLSDIDALAQDLNHAVIARDLVAVESGFEKLTKYWASMSAEPSL